MLPCAVFPPRKKKQRCSEHAEENSSCTGHRHLSAGKYGRGLVRKCTGVFVPEEVHAVLHELRVEFDHSIGFLDGIFQMLSLIGSQTLDSVKAFHRHDRTGNKGSGTYYSQGIACEFANRTPAFLGAKGFGPAYGPVERLVGDRIVPEMPEEIIERTIDKYVQAALTSKTALLSHSSRKMSAT